MFCKRVQKSLIVKELSKYSFWKSAQEYENEGLNFSRFLHKSEECEEEELFPTGRMKCIGWTDPRGFRGTAGRGRMMAMARSNRAHQNVLIIVHSYGLSSNTYKRFVCNGLEGRLSGFARDEEKTHPRMYQACGDGPLKMAYLSEGRLHETSGAATRRRNGAVS
jgi:hypothetical protein